MKVMTLLGTRPELIKLCLVLKELDRHFDHVLIHSGQNYDYELNQVFFEDLGVRKPDEFLDAAGETAMETVAQVLVKTDQMLEKHKPDAFLIYGDTNSCLAVIAAKRRKIPIFHMEAGNRCFDDRVPEEINRKIVDHLSDINMPLTEHGRKYLEREGIRPERIIRTGSCMREVLEHYRPQWEKSDVISRLGLKEKGYYLFSSHREENVDREDHLLAILNSMNQLAEATGRDVIFSAHPRTRKRIDAIGGFQFHPKVQYMKPLGFHDYIHLQVHSSCTLSDSGTIMEESALLGFPAVSIRQAHERPEGMDEGVLVVCPPKLDRLMDSVKVVEAASEARGRQPFPVRDYQVDKVSQAVAKIILSYRDYVSRVVWSEG